MRNNLRNFICQETTYSGEKLHKRFRQAVHESLGSNKALLQCQVSCSLVSILPSCCFRVGQDVAFDELVSNYDAIVLAYGSYRQRKLQIPGDKSTNVISGSDFVAWYNGVPNSKVRAFPIDFLIYEFISNSLGTEEGNDFLVFKIE